jgi:hypothetical protein
MNAIVVIALLVGGVPARAQSPVCDGKFHWVDVAGTVCLDGSSTGITYLCQAGTAGPLLVYLDSGGICWDGDGCQCDPDPLGYCTKPGSLISNNSFGKAASLDGLPRAETRWGQDAVFGGPSSPFNQDWNFALIPYCTGDAHWGDAEKAYPTATGTINAHHRGYRNVTRDIPVIKSLFQAPSRIVMWGDSAGAYGVAGSIGQVTNAWPGVSLEAFESGLAPYDSVAAPKVPAAGLNWGAWRRAPDGSVIALTAPAAVPPGTPNTWSPLAITNYDRLHYPAVKQAWTDDYSDFALAFFACQLGAIQDASGSCASAVAAVLNEGFGLLGDDPAFRVYFHTGICHNERDWDGNTVADGSDPSCDYDNMVQPPKAGQKYVDNCKADANQTCFRDWVREFVNGSPAWGNVR